MRYILYTVLILILAGCGGGGNQYLLSMDNQVKHYKKRSTQIGIDKISVPGYMEESKIATEVSQGEIHYLDSKWAVPTSRALTKTLIRTLQRRFDNPNVQLYPWDIDSQNGVRVKVIINDFIYSNGVVRLEAVYTIMRVDSSRKRSYIYKTTVASTEDIPSVVRAMSRAFTKLSLHISKKI